ncbi:MAG: DUF2080 family transposase-associated protein [Nanoarchaeota archaeon]|nr:DUF2080 family transposase-associated protein [Nanoarchaeota archaeon]
MRIDVKEQIVREVTRVGNGAHIFTPKEWLGEEVVLTRIKKKSIKEKILDILSLHLESIKGVYLYGSNARGEAEKDSDIDLLIICNKKITIKEKGFEIICLEEDSIKKALEISPILIYSALNEAIPIINEELLEKLKKQYPPELDHFHSYVQETFKMIKINESILDPYSIIFRLKGIYIIDQLLRKEKYSNKKFKKWVLQRLPRIDFTSIYKAYKEFKENKKSIKVNDEQLKSILSFLKEQTIDMESIIHDKKRKKA